MVLLGGILYGTMSSFVKLSYAKGYTAAELSFAQAGLAAIFLSVIFLCSYKRNNEQKISFKKLTPLLLIGGTIGLTNFFYYLSVSYISASLAIVILMQFTWISILLEWIIFKKRPTKLEFLTVAVILVGTALASDLVNMQELNFSIKGLLLVLLASLTYAIYIIANGHTGQHVSWQAKSSLIMLGSAITIFTINANTIIFENHFSLDFLYTALFLAVIGTTIPTALFAAGIPKVGAGISAILMTIELPVAVICASVVLNESLSLTQILGIVLMLGAIAYMNYYKSRKSIKTT